MPGANLRRCATTLSLKETTLRHRGLRAEGILHPRSSYNSVKNATHESLTYRTLELKDKIDSMSTTDAVELLRSDGMLIKRPFLVKGTDVHVGMKQL